MYLLHRIGPRHSSNWNTLDEIVACQGPISFDGIYEEVLWNADKLVGKDITLFFMGNYVGGNNSFDKGQPHGRYLDWPELRYLVAKLHAKLGFHSWSHKDLTTLSTAEIRREVAPPFSMDYFAYPHGRVDARVAEIVREAGYKEAWAAGPHGDGSQFQRKRKYLGW
jgi:hypothetical protein